MICFNPDYTYNDTYLNGIYSEVILEKNHHFKFILLSNEKLNFILIETSINLMKMNILKIQF